VSVRCARKRKRPRRHPAVPESSCCFKLSGPDARKPLAPDAAFSLIDWTAYVHDTDRLDPAQCRVLPMDILPPPSRATGLPQSVINRLRRAAGKKVVASIGSDRV
jgi:hypothetical protein